MSTPKVFVSYSRSDESLAKELLRTLRLMQVEVWSADQLKAGDNWSDVLRSHIRDSEYFVLLLTPKTFDSPWVLQELGAAWALGKRIIPIASDRRLIDKLPVDLGGVRSLTVDEIDKLDDVIERVA